MDEQTSSSPALPISQGAFNAAVNLLRHSWADIEYKYEGLTEPEKACITPEQFAEISDKLIHSPERPVVHHLTGHTTPCGFHIGGNEFRLPRGHHLNHGWDCVTCPDCLKHKPA